MIAVSADIIPRKLIFRDREVAALLGVCERTVRRYKNEGRFGGLATVNRNTRVTYAGLMSYLREAAAQAEK